MERFGSELIDENKRQVSLALRNPSVLGPIVVYKPNISLIDQEQLPF